MNQPGFIVLWSFAAILCRISKPELVPARPDSHSCGVQTGSARWEVVSSALGCSWKR